MTGFEEHAIGMTNTDPHSTTATIHPGPLGAEDPRLAFARAVALGGRVISAVRADQLADPTPCDEFDVRDLLGHLIIVPRRLAAVARGEDALSVPDVLDGIPDGGWLAAWEAAAHDVQAAFVDDAVLARPLVFHFATMPGAVALGVYTSEVTVHTWDLAKATGQHPTWDDAVAVWALATMQRTLVAENRGDGIPFGPVVDVAQDAPAIDRLVAWNGRRP